MNFWAVLCILFVCSSGALAQHCGADQGDCSTCPALYSGCNAADHALGFFKKSIGLCPNVTHKIEHFARVMLNKSVEMVPLIHQVCPNGTFCPLAIFDHGGCIPHDANCSDFGAMRLLNGSRLEDDKANSDRLLVQCVRSPNVLQCIAEGVAAWVGFNDSMIAGLFNGSCSDGTKFCVAAGRCLDPQKERCHDVSFHHTCEPTHAYCLSKLGCIPKDQMNPENCPPPLSPLIFRLFAILQNPGEIDNTTFHFLYQLGMSHFCFANKVARAVVSREMHQCEGRDAHCRRVGHDAHEQCLKAHEGCMNPMRDLGVCPLISTYCRGMRKDLPDIVKGMVSIMEMNFHVGWDDLCNQGKALCQVLEKEIGTCPQANASKVFCAVPDLPMCDNNERFCPRVNACRPADECACPDEKKNCNGTCIDDGQPCDAGHDSCDDKYKSCKEPRETVAGIYWVAGFCHQMMGNPDRFVQFLRNQTSSVLLPLMNMACPDGLKFCLMAPHKMFCIPAKANCTAIGALAPGSDPDEMNDTAGYFKGGFKTIWNDECPKGSIYCKVLSRCAPIRECSLSLLSHWVEKNDTMRTPLNQSCPAQSSYCLAKGRCIPEHDECPDLASALCDESERFCYSSFKCIPKEGNCTIRKFPFGLQVAALAENTSEVVNKSYRDLAHSGWAQFCFVRKALHQNQLRAHGMCEARKKHCWREGYEDHQKCLQRNSKCWAPLGEVCGGLDKVCHDVMEHMPDVLRKMLKLVAEQLHFPFDDICRRGKRACDVFDRSLRMCKAVNVSEDECSVTEKICGVNEQHCPSSEGCKPIGECDCGEDGKDCDDGCSRLYTPCRHIGRNIALIENAGRLCGDMIDDPAGFVAFLNNQSDLWTPPGNGSCPDDKKFCIIDIIRGGGGCIPLDASCSAVFSEHLGPSKENSVEDHDAKDQHMTPWNDRCPNSFIFCEYFGHCAPRSVCSLQHLASFVGLNTSKKAEFIACPPGFRFCLAKARCIEEREKCHEMDFPLDIVMELPDELKNDTSRILAETGWSQFCLVNQALQMVYNQTMLQCDTREYHCQKDGYEHHMTCLRNNSGCWNPIREACEMAFSICDDVTGGLSPFLQYVLRMVSEEIKMPLYDVCRQGRSLCALLDSSVDYCLPLEAPGDKCVLKDLPSCTGNKRFCPRLKGCATIADCNCANDQASCQGNCSRLYASCSDVRRTLGFISETGHLCPKMFASPDNFVAFLMNQSESWSPLADKACEGDQKFCPLAIASGFCIMRHENCSADGNKTQKSESNEISEGGKDPRCGDNSEYCDFLRLCVPKGKCSIPGLVSWLSSDDPRATPTGDHCSEGERFCLSQMKCIPENDGCDFIDEEVECNGTHKWCYSNFHCVRKDQDCPSSAFPVGLVAALTQEADKVSNGTYRELIKQGWAPFCYMNREIRAVMSSSLRRCHARHLHCRRDGYENHVNCMRMSRGGCLDPIKLACREGLKFCHMAKNETTDIIRLVQEVSAELFQIRLPDVCKVGRDICSVLKQSVQFCLPMERDENACTNYDLPHCGENQRYCPRTEGCEADCLCGNPEDCKDDCLQMYSMCDDMYESIAVLEKSRRYCANMVENPEDFLKTSNGSWAPIGNGSCGENEQFCPLAFGCISRDSKCPGLGGLLPSMENVTAEEEDEDDWESTPEGPPAPKLAWQTRCPAGFVYCEIADRCVPDRTYCMLHHVIALMAMNNSKLNQLFNISCPPEHRFCLGEGRCIPKGEKCALFQLPYSALMSLPAEIRNETYRFIVETGPAPFCLASDLLGHVSGASRETCSARGQHCVKQGYVAHMKCLNDSSKCFNPIKDICPPLIDFCEDAMGALPDFLKAVLSAVGQGFDIRVADLCGIVKSVCGLLENSLNTCHRVEIPADRCLEKLCAENEVFCPQSQKCVLPDQCATTPPPPTPSTLPTTPPISMTFLPSGSSPSEVIESAPALIGLKHHPTPDGKWTYENQNGLVDFTECAEGQVVAVQSTSKLKFHPHGAFHGVVNLTAYKLEGGEEGKCVAPQEDKPITIVLSLVWPDVYQFNLTVHESTFGVDEDEKSDGKKLSEIFGVTIPDFKTIEIDPLIKKYIPEDDLTLYQRINNNFENFRVGIVYAEVMEPKLGRIQFKKGFGWVTLPQSTAIDLDSDGRILPNLDQHGETKIKVKPAVWLPRKLPSMASAPLDVKKMVDMAKKEKDLVEDADDFLSFVISCVGKSEGDLDHVAQDISSHLSQKRPVYPRQVFEFIEKVHGMVPDKSEGDCRAADFSSMCFSGGQETTVRIVINSVDDPPKLVDPDDQDVYFPPVPYNLSSLPEEGISIAALTKNNNKLLRLLTSFSRGEEALQILSQGGTLLTLIEKVDVPSYVREVLDQPLMYDESPEVGIAIVFNRWPEFGKWVYNIDGSWKDVDVNNTVDALKSGRDIEALFLSPKARLKFLPKDESTFWTQGQADIKSFLIIFGWDGSDNSTSGKRVVNTSDVANTITRDPLFLVVDRLGCDKRPGSMATSDECGECRGRGRCIGCDGKANSGAKYDKCGKCVNGTTGMSTVFDCSGGCMNKSFVDGCGKCQVRGKVRISTDCNNTCKGKPGYGAKLGCNQVCVGGNTGKSLDYGKDKCGICGGDDGTCADCKGVPNGGRLRDSCRVCRLPDDQAFDACVAIKKANPTVASGKGGTRISVWAASLTEANAVAKCWFEDDQNRKEEQGDADIINGKSFELTLKPIPAGEYLLKCTFDDSGTEYPYNATKFVFFGNDTKIVSASPNETEVNTAVNVTLTGVGFVNTTELVCLAGKTGKPAQFKAQYVNSTSIVCFIEPVKRAGLYSLGVSFSGGTETDIEVDVSVYAIAPTPLQCRFDDVAPFVECTLDKPAQSSKDCQKVLKESSLDAFGSSPRCRLRDKRLRISLSRGYNISAGDNVTFLLPGFEGKNAEVSKHPAGKTEQQITVGAAQNPRPLKVHLTGSVEVASCDAFSLLVESNIKHGLRYEWSAASPSNASDSSGDLARLNAKLASVTWKRVKITDEYVLPGTTYTVTVKLHQGSSGQTVEDSMDITRNADPIPQLYFDENNYTIKASIKLRLRANIQPSRCLKEAKYKMNFAWEYPNWINVGDVFAKGPRLSIKKGWFPGKLHEFKLTATMADYRSLTTSATVFVYVEEVDLVATIAGGDSITIGENETLVLDGTKSNDPNALTNVALYSWECVDVEFELPCESLTSADLLVLPDEARVEIAPGILEPGFEYRFTLTFRKGEKTSEATVTRTLKKGVVPKIDLTVAPGKVNPNKKLTILANVESSLDELLLQWACDIVDEEGYEYIELEDALVSKISKKLTKNPADQVVKAEFPMVTKANVLIGGAIYRLQLNGYLPDGTLLATASVEILTNAPPSQGPPTIAPDTGSAFSTEFQIAASDVYDEPGDGPFTYRCGCKDFTKEDAVQYRSTSSESETCEFKLPAGDPNNNNTQMCFIEVTDAAGATSRSEYVLLTVTPRVLDESDVKNGTDDIKRRLGAGDIAQAASEVTAILQSLEGDLSDEVQALKEELQSFAANALVDDFSSRDRDDKESFKEALIALAETTNGLAYSDQDTANKVVDTFTAQMKAQQGNSGGESRRRRRDVNVGAEEEVEAKEIDEVEPALDIYSNLIVANDYRNSSMEMKAKAISTVDELGRSLCKGLVTGEPAAVAQSQMVVLRSEQSAFDTVDQNYSSISCDSCRAGVNTSAQVLLGQSLKGQYESWTCSGEDCNGACIVSAQYPDDLLLNHENLDRVSDVIYVKLFDPKKLSPLSVSGLPHPVNYKVPLRSYNASKGEPKCHAWDSGAAAWSTVGLTTGEISSDGGVSFIQCSNDALGFIAIFLVEIEATTPTPNVTTAPPVEETPAFVQLSLDAEYANFVNESTKADFIADVKEGIANELGVNESRITELTVAPGSIIVTFKLLPGGAGDKNISTLVALLQSKVQSGGLNITLGDGRTLTADPNSFVLHGATLPPPTTAAPTTTQPPSTATDAPKPSTGPSGLSQTMLIVIIVVSCVVGIVIIVVIVLCVRAKNRRSKIEASSAEDPTPPPERAYENRNTRHAVTSSHDNASYQPEGGLRAKLPGNPDSSSSHSA